MWVTFLSSATTTFRKGVIMSLEDYHDLAYWADDLSSGNEDPPDLADEERRIRMASDKAIDARLALLRDDRQPDARIPAALAPPGESVLAFQRRIRGLLVGDDYLYAEATLRGILATVTNAKRVTRGQIDAVDRIADHPGNVVSRRWGGW